MVSFRPFWCHNFLIPKMMENLLCWDGWLVDNYCPCVLLRKPKALVCLCTFSHNTAIACFISLEQFCFPFIIAISCPKCTPCYVGGPFFVWSQKHVVFHLLVTIILLITLLLLTNLFVFDLGQFSSSKAFFSLSHWANVEHLCACIPYNMGSLSVMVCFSNSKARHCYCCQVYFNLNL